MKIKNIFNFTSLLFTFSISVIFIISLVHITLIEIAYLQIHPVSKRTTMTAANTAAPKYTHKSNILKVPSANVQ